jgi:RNA polymerase sigma factor, sigma-70 family
MNESELIANIQNGDSDSFGRIFNLYKNKAVRTAYLITGNYASAEDAVQEAFVKCYFEIGGLKNPECFRAWFYKLLVRTAWRFTESEKKNIPVEDIFDEAIVSGEKSAEQLFLDSELTNALLSEIQKLDKKKRTTVMLYYYSELSTKEIARVMGCLEGTVKSRLHFARKNLKRNMKIVQLKEDGYYGKAEYESGL